ncbi:MAG TPA: cyclic nucleotide-binding domain-containing protein [Spirochaetes bacterium]|nr:cyclic nucleotide-binding domain-containing protein [Spirochaetota bacterium]
MDENLSEKISETLSENLSKLRNIVLFKDFKDNIEVLEKIEGLFSEKISKKGDVIIKEGDEGDELYIIKTGSVLILKNTLQNEAYTVVKLSAQQHVFFGEIGLLLNDKRSATVTAEVDSTLLMTNRKKFLEFGEQEAYIALLITRQIAQILSKRLLKSNQDVVTLFSALVDEIEGGTVMD